MDSHVYSISPQGKTNWMFAMSNVTYSSAAIDNDGTIYIGSDDGNLYALDRNGNRKWKFKTGTYVESSPGLAADGTIYIGGLDGYFRAFDANGHGKWIQAPGAISASPAICADGSVLVASYQNGLYAYSPTGAILWSLPAGWPNVLFTGRNEQWNNICRRGNHALFAAGHERARKWPVGYVSKRRETQRALDTAWIVLANYPRQWRRQSHHEHRNRSRLYRAILDRPPELAGTDKFHAGSFANDAH
jgi:hypothetical protein